MLTRIKLKLKALAKAHHNHQIGTYMDRWYIVPPVWNLPFCIRLHHIHRSDNERLHHNHPYAFKSIVLKGDYLESQVMNVVRLPGMVPYLACRTVEHRLFRIVDIAQEKYHRLMAVSEGGVWTIVIHPRKPKQCSWGYLQEDGTHIPHDDYVRPPGYNLPYKEKRNNA